MRALFILCVATLAMADTPPADPPASAPPPIDAPSIVTPSRAEIDTLVGELSLLDRAATQHVVIPSDARSLGELLESLTAQAGLPVEADWEALSLLRISADDPPPLDRGEGSLLAVLDALCLSMGVPYDRPRAEAILGRMRIVNARTLNSLRRTRAYQADQLADEFLMQATEHVDPDGWVRNGGESQHVTRIDGTLLVSAPATIHRQLAMLLHDLELTRPTTVELAAEIIRIPARAWREQSAKSEGARAVSGSALVAEAGATMVASPTLVAVIGNDARLETAAGAIALTVAFHPERDEERGTIVRFELTAGHDGATAMSQGTVPALFAGLAPAIVAVDLPGAEETLVMFLRVRPLPRSTADPSP